MWGHMDGYSGYGGWMVFGGLTMILFWVILILAIAALWKYVARSQIPPANRPEKSAVQMLEERYARGEINKEEFLEKKKDLTGGN